MSANSQSTPSNPKTLRNETLFPVDVSPWREWCEGRDHPTITFNSWQDRSWCLCGATTADGKPFSYEETCGLIAESRLWRWGK